MRKVGLQLYSVKEAMEKDLAETLKTVSSQGYEGVQLAGDCGKDAKEWKALLSNYQLETAGMHVPVDVLQDEQLLHKWIEFSREIGNEKLIIPYVDEAWRSKEKFEELAELLNTASEKVKESGLVLGYHHHDFEFTPLETGETGWEILEKLTRSYPVYFEIDVYWTEYSGVDTTALIQQLGDRVFSVHIKDLIEVDGERKTGPVGKGVLDLKSISDQSSTDWLVVEQEHFDGEPLHEVGPSAAKVKGWIR